LCRAGGLGFFPMNRLPIPGGKRSAAIAATMVFLLGASVLAGWAFKIDVLKSVMADWVTMKPNTALGLILCGIALGLSEHSRIPLLRWIAFTAAALLIAIGAMTLSEYLFGLNFAIDELLFRDYSQPLGDSLPAGMSPLSAYCFILAGIALEVAASPARKRKWMPFVAAIGATLVTVGTVAILGYAIDGIMGVQWWNYTGLALHTAIGFGILGLGIIAMVSRSGDLVWSLGRNTSLRFALGILTLLASAGISYHFTAQLRSASASVSHTQDALREFQAISTANVAMQSAFRGFLMDPDHEYVADITRAENALRLHTVAARQLTIDNERQQIRLDKFEPILALQIGNVDYTVDLDRKQGRAAAEEYFATGPIRKLAVQFRIVVRELRDGELKLLASRSEAAALAERTAFLVLPLGTFLSVALLVMGLFFLNAGAHERDKAERRLQASFSEIERMKNELEIRVAERTRQLEMSNKELEAFSYSVSHDLRAPLRAVDGFSQAIIEDFGPAIPLEGHRQLNVIRSSTQKMGELIDDLLTFSRLSRQPLSLMPVDTMALVSSVLADMKDQLAGRDVKITVGTLPPCQSDPSLLRQVWVNLLSNAVKYTAKCEHAVVDVGFLIQEGESVFFVRDNGTGFDMRYAGKLFGVFQRLHRSEDYEGTGVGLAIVQRIVHRHEGRVWADAAVGVGATFFFTLEKKPNP
jgi:signal transduction histidine kinase